MEASPRAVPAILFALTDKQEARNLSWTLSTHYECIIIFSGGEALTLASTHIVAALIPGR